MARPIRVQYEGAVYHVMARGNGGDQLFHGHRDRLRFLDTVEEMVEQFDVDVHAYCLMAGHYHLVLGTPLGNLSQAVGWLQDTYAIRFNRRHRRHGHVFAGRFKAVLVEADAYAQWLVMYVHLNPVRPAHRQEMIPPERAPRLERYRWSSHQAYAGRRQAPDWLCLDWLRYWGKSRASAQRAYRREVVRMFGQPIESLDERVRGSLALCGEKMWEQVQELVGDKAGQEEEGWTRREQQEAVRERVEKLIADEEDKRVQIWALVRLAGQRRVEVARRYGYSNGSGVTQVVDRLEARAQRDKHLRTRLNRLRQKCKV